MERTSVPSHIMVFHPLSGSTIGYGMAQGKRESFFLVNLSCMHDACGRAGEEMGELNELDHQ